MRTTALACIAVALTTTTAAQAQELVQWAAPTSAESGRYAYFPMGTGLRLTTRTELNTKANNPGDRFYLETAEPLIYRGQVVLPVGSVAVGEVMRSEHNGVFGKKGQLEVRLLYVQTPSGPVRLSGQSARSGTGRELLSIGGALVIAWPMLFIHGTSGRLPANTSLTAYLADDLRFPILADTAQTASAVSPDGATGRVLSARFDPTVFASNRP